MGGGLSINSPSNAPNNPYVQQQHLSLISTKKQNTIISSNNKSPSGKDSILPLNSNNISSPSSSSNLSNYLNDSTDCEYLLHENKNQGILSIQFLATSSSLDQLPYISNPNNKFLQISSTSKPVVSSSSSFVGQNSSVINTTIDIPPRGVILHGSSLNPLNLINNLEKNPFFSMLPPPSICLPDFRAHSLFLSYCHGWHLIPLPPTVFSRHSSTCLVLGDKDYHYGDYALRVGDCLRLGSVGLVVTEMRTFSGLEERIDPNVLQKLTNEVDNSSVSYLLQHPNANVQHFQGLTGLNPLSGPHSPSHQTGGSLNSFALNTHQANLAHRLNQEERDLDDLHEANSPHSPSHSSIPNASSPFSGGDNPSTPSRNTLPMKPTSPEKNFNIEDDIADLVPGLSQKFYLHDGEEKDQSDDKSSFPQNNDEKSDRKNANLYSSDSKHEFFSQQCSSSSSSSLFADQSSYNSNMNIYCYMCYETTHTFSNPLISPCSCRGDTRYLHLSCLREWYHSSYGGNQSGGSNGRDDSAEGISRVIRTSKTGTLSCRVCNTPYKSYINLPIKSKKNDDKNLKSDGKNIKNEDKNIKNPQLQKKLINIWDEDEKIPYISLLVITKHDANPTLFNSKFRINFRPSSSNGTNGESNISTQTGNSIYTSNLSANEKEIYYNNMDLNDTNSYSPILVGRSSSSHLILDYRTVSTHHAQIFYKKGKFYIKDLKSSNGTMLFIQHPLRIPSHVISSPSTQGISSTSQTPTGSPGPANNSSQSSSAASSSNSSTSSISPLNSSLKIKLGRTTITIKEKKLKNDWSNFFSRVVFSPVRRLTNSQSPSNEDRDESKIIDDEEDDNSMDDELNGQNENNEDTEDEKEDDEQTRGTGTDSSSASSALTSSSRFKSSRKRRRERAREEKMILSNLLNPNFDFFREYQFVHKGRPQENLPSKKLIHINKKKIPYNNRGEGPTARAVQLLLQALPYINIEQSYLYARPFLMQSRTPLLEPHLTDSNNTRDHQREFQRILEEDFNSLVQNTTTTNAAAQSEAPSSFSQPSTVAPTAPQLSHMDTFIEDPSINFFRNNMPEEEKDPDNLPTLSRIASGNPSIPLRNPSNDNTEEYRVNNTTNQTLFESSSRTALEQETNPLGPNLNSSSSAANLSSSSSQANLPPTTSSFVIVNNHSLSSTNLHINNQNYYQNITNTSSNDDLREIMRVIPSRMRRDSDADQTIIDDENTHNEDEKEDENIIRTNSYFFNHQEEKDDDIETVYNSREETRRDSRNLNFSLLNEEHKEDFKNDETDKKNFLNKSVTSIPINVSNLSINNKNLRNIPFESNDSDHFFIPLDDCADVSNVSLSQFELEDKTEAEKTDLISECKNIYNIKSQEKLSENSFES